MKKKQNKRILDMIGIGVFTILLIGSIIIGINLLGSKETMVKEDLNLEQYRSIDIPDQCRLPTYENRIESWKEHLGHHENTWYCLDYFE